MTRTGTIILVLLAIGAGIFLFFLEPGLEPRLEPGTGAAILPAFNRGDISKITIVSGDESFELSRKDEGWRVGPELKDRASKQAVESLISEIAELQASDRLHPADLEEHGGLREIGLANPRNRIQIEFRSGEVEELQLGKEAVVEGRMFLKRGGGKFVHLVPSTLAEMAFRNPEDFRDRRLTDLLPEQISRFVLRRKDGELELVRGPTGWHFVKPFRARADAAKVERFLSPVLGSAILRFVADNTYDLSGHGSGEARAELILFREGDERSQALRIGSEVPAESPAGETSLIAQFTARDAVYHLPGRLWDHLQVTPEDLRDRRLLMLNLDTIDAIRIIRNQERSELRRTDSDHWVRRRENAAPPETAIEPGVIERRVGRLQSAEVLRYLPASREILESHGFTEQPDLELYFDSWLSENTPESSAGRHPVARLVVGKITESEAFVRIDESSEIAVVPAEIFRSF